MSTEPTNTARLPENPKLRAIATAFALDVPQLISEAETKILEAWSECEQEAQENDAKPVFKLGFAISLDLDSDKMETKLSFSVRFSKTIERAIPDPNQPTLPLDRDGETTVEVSGGGITTGKISIGEFSKRARKIAGKGGRK